MFDIHSHIIDGVDDGARTLEEAAELVAMDMAEGAEAIIATPHYYLNQPTDPEVIRTRLEELRRALRETGKGSFPDGEQIELYEGNEVLWFESMTEKLQSGEILTLSEDAEDISMGIDLTEKSGIRLTLGSREKWLKEKGESTMGRFSFGIYGCWVKDSEGNLDYVHEQDYTDEIWAEQEKAIARNSGLKR